MSNRPRFLFVCALGSLVAGCSDEGGSASNDAEGSGAGVMPGLGDGETNESAAISPGADDTLAAAPGPAGMPPSGGAAMEAIDPSSPAVSGADVVAGPAVPTDDAPPIVAPAPVPPETPSGQSGLLTAGTWDDNLNMERFLDYRDELLQLQMAGLPPIEAEEYTAANEQGIGEPREHQSLDVALIVDTTGSMGDELSYLQTEFDALSASIENAYPEAKQRWSLVLYRDQGDEYVTRWFDFRTDLDEFRDLLAEQSAGGGGDIPEAPDEALSVMTELGWRTSANTARLAFWVADAPHHGENADAFAGAIRVSQTLGVHIYPVASSGIDELTEFSMRASAQLTGGRYIFLTDDSGVGGEHKEPSIPCYYVTRLDDAILRMVDIEMSGVYREPSADEVIRKGGDPHDGGCTLESGVMVKAF